MDKEIKKLWEIFCIEEYGKIEPLGLYAMCDDGYDITSAVSLIEKNGELILSIYTKEITKEFNLKRIN